MQLVLVVVLSIKESGAAELRFKFFGFFVFSVDGEQFNGALFSFFRGDFRLKHILSTFLFSKSNAFLFF